MTASSVRSPFQNWFTMRNIDHTWRLRYFYIDANRLCAQQAYTVLGMSAAREAARISKRAKKPVRQKIVLRLPDLDHAKSSVLNSLSSPRSRRNYKFAMEQFIIWYWSEPRLL
jgi:hypothetical protein